MIEPIGNNIWIENQDLVLGGGNFGTRMTIIRLDGDDLFVHSPARLSDSLKSDIDRLGQVRYIIAPNSFHNLFIRDFIRTYPNADVFGVKRTKKFVDNPDSVTLLEKGSTYPWQNSILTYPLHLGSFYEEIVFFHPESKTLIITDLAMNFKKRRPLKDRLVFKLLGVGSEFGPTRLFRFISDNRSELKSQLDMLSDLNFDRIIMAHGDLIEHDGRNVLRSSFKWLELPPNPLMTMIRAPMQKVFKLGLKGSSS